MIYYWSYDANMISRRVHNHENIRFFSRCKKYIVFTKDNIHIHCINPVMYYKTWSDVTDHMIEYKIFDKDLDFKIRKEESIAKALVDAIFIPPSAKYICFSDTHGDICSLCIGIGLYLKHRIMTIDCGDTIHYRFNLWSDDEVDPYEDLIRNNYSTIITNYFTKQFNYFSLRGNHDDYKSLIRIVVQNDERQIIFNHAIINSNDEDKLILCKQFFYKGDNVRLYKSDSPVEFYHSFGNPAISLTDLEDRIKLLLNVTNFNPYIICGHDNNYMYLVGNKSDMFPVSKLTNKDILIGDLNDDSLFGRFICTDGLLKKLI